MKFCLIMFFLGFFLSIAIKNEATCCKRPDGTTYQIASNAPNPCGKNKKC